MKAATLKQSTKILSLFEETPLEQVQSLLMSGLLADLRDADITKISRVQFRRVCGLGPLTPEFPLWRTLTIGGVSKDELLRKLGDGFYISDWAKGIMAQPGFTTLPQLTEIQLVKARVKDLGFTEPPTTTELLARIREGGDLCPAEVGPHLLLNLTYQSRNDWFAV
ncbi:MAG: hypothetical protein AAB476_01655, partial [Patescibacteria group bacterium]